MSLNLTGIYSGALTNSTLSQVTSITSVHDYFAAIKPLAIFVAAVVIYSVFVFKFYRFLARRDILKLKMKKYYQGFEGFLEQASKLIVYVIENLIVIPVLVFFWFIILAGFILVLSKNQPLDTVLLTSMAIIAAVRITAHYSEDLSRDLSKMIPFALLGIFIVDMSFFSMQETIATAQTLPMHLDILVFYLLFVVILEFLMRIAGAIINSFRKDQEDLKAIEGE